MNSISIRRRRPRVNHRQCRPGSNRRILNIRCVHADTALKSSAITRLDRAIRKADRSPCRSVRALYPIARSASVDGHEHISTDAEASWHHRRWRLARRAGNKARAGSTLMLTIWRHPRSRIFTLWCFVISTPRYALISRRSWRCLVHHYPVDRRHGRSISMLTRTVLSLAAVSFVGLFGPAEAQTYDPRYPVCMTRYSGPSGGQWIDCSYASLPQCQASASGRAAMCSINPYFVVRPGERPRVRHRRHVS